MLIRFVPTGKNQWDVKIAGRKAARIEKRRGVLVARTTRFCSKQTFDAIAVFMQSLA